MTLTNSKFGGYYNPRFTEIWEDVETFLMDYTECPIPQMITEENATTLYYLLYARYGNDVISSTDRERFKYMVFTLIFQYGATWQKRMEIQKKLRELGEKDIELGNTHIHNHAYNPSTEPDTDAFSPLPFTNEQNAQRVKRGKLEGYAMLNALLETDITGEFLDRFRTLFTPIAAPQTALYYNVPGLTDTDTPTDEYLEV